MKSRKSDGFMAAAARYTSIAMTLPGATLAGYLIGLALDYWLHTHYLYIVFLILGIISGFYELIRNLMQDMNASDKNISDNPRKNPPPSDDAQ